MSSAGWQRATLRWLRKDGAVDEDQSFRWIEDDAGQHGRPSRCFGTSYSGMWQLEIEGFPPLLLQPWRYERVSQWLADHGFSYVEGRIFRCQNPKTRKYVMDRGLHLFRRPVAAEPMAEAAVQRRLKADWSVVEPDDARLLVGQADSR